MLALGLCWLQSIQILTEKVAAGLEGDRLSQARGTAPSCIGGVVDLTPPSTSYRLEHRTSYVLAFLGRKALITDVGGGFNPQAGDVAPSF